MIISVGYRVKSQRGILFRKWANKVLKEYLIQGYSVNNKRLEKLNKVIDIQNKMLSYSKHMYNVDVNFLSYDANWRDASHKEFENAAWGCPWKLAKADLNKTGKTIVCGHWHTSDFFNNLKNLKVKYNLYENNPIFFL